ncbi:hypothetical protein LY76DRAFT_597809 [Colletotrichum caudatum]|nr:hypothetical protein LY76DRAFT_597809 [Colletotrichum caudatum]
MKDFPKEIVRHILRRVDFDSLKKCRLVCRQWCRIVPEFLFRRVYSAGPHFKDIVSRKGLSSFVRIISVENTAKGQTSMSLLPFIADNQTLQQLVPLPTVGVIRQHRGNKFTVTLTRDLL